MATMKIARSNPGKLLLFGEHAAVYGYPALGTALDQTVRLSITTDGTGNWTAPDVPGVRDGEWHRFFDHVRSVAAAENLEQAEFAVRGVVTLKSDLPLSGGFGSSAALCSAFARVLLDLDRLHNAPEAGHPDPAHPEREQADDPRRVWHVANELERFFHGTPSGIDTGLAVLGGTLLFHFDQIGSLPTATPVRGPLTPLLVGSVPRTGNTRELVGRIRAAMEDGHATTARAMEQLGSIAAGAAERLPEADAEELGSLSNEAHRILRDLDLTSDLLEKALSAGRIAGARGGKLSGAGGGGAFFLVYPDDETAREGRFVVAEALRSAGAEAAAETLFISAPKG